MLGALWGIGLLLVLVGAWKVVLEYRYYQILKKEHQAWFLDEFGKTPEGKSFTRAQFFDAMVMEQIKARQPPAVQEAPEPTKGPVHASPLQQVR